MARQKKISKGQIINSIKAVADALQDDGTSISEVYRMMLGQTKPAESMLASFLGKSKELYKVKNLIEPDDIKFKRLFFDEQTNNEFKNISNALSDSKFYKLQKNLEDNAMPTGLTATTNLIDSLDPAFERRFLYKVRFGKPSVETKMKIWGSKMPQLSPSDIEYLARTYDLSGGEIDNIVRKTLLNEIVGNISDVTLESVVELCEKEKVEIGEIERKVVGFRN